MLRKLVKYDLKSLFKNMWIFYVLLLIDVIVNFILNNYGNRTLALNIIEPIVYLSLILYLLGFILFSVYKTISRYRNNLYTDEGYLTFTLPVSKSKLFFAKFISGFTFNVINFIVVIVSYLFGLSFIFTKNSCFMKALNNISSGCTMGIFESKIEEYKYIFNTDYWVVIVFLIGIVLLNIICVILSGYFGTTLGSKCNNNKKSKSVTFSVVTYFLTILLIISVFSIIGKTNPELSLFFNNYDRAYDLKGKYMLLRKMLCLYVFLQVFIDSALYFMGNKLLNKGINLE